MPNSPDSTRTREVDDEHAQDEEATADDDENVDDATCEQTHAGPKNRKREGKRWKETARFQRRDLVLVQVMLAMVLTLSTILVEIGSPSRIAPADRGAQGPRGGDLEVAEATDISGWRRDELLWQYQRAMRFDS